MKCEWRNSLLGDFVQIKGGKRLPKGIGLQTIPNGHPYIRIRDMGKCKILNLNSDYEYVDDITQKSISRYIVNEGDIVISIVGTIGLVGIVGSSLNDANLTENCVRLINSGKLDRDYLYYYLISDVGQSEIRRGIVGAVQPKLPIKNIQEINIRFPVEVHLQTKIAKVLSALDDKIELNNQINKNLEEQAKSIYSKMFIESRPADYANGTLNEIADITMGQSPVGSSYNEEGLGEIFFQGRAEFGERFPTIRLYTTEPKRMAFANDTLISVRAPVGDLNVAHKYCCIGRGLAAIHSKTNHQSFLLYTMFSLKRQLEVFNGEGTVFGSINRDSLRNIAIYIPSIDKINDFENLVAPIDLEIRNNYDQICALQQIRDKLLPKLMSGEIDVDNVEI